MSSMVTIDVTVACEETTRAPFCCVALLSSSTNSGTSPPFMPYWGKYSKYFCCLKSMVLETFTACNHKQECDQFMEWKLNGKSKNFFICDFMNCIVKITATLKAVYENSSNKITYGHNYHNKPSQDPGRITIFSYSRNKLKLKLKITAISQQTFARSWRDWT